MIEIDGRDSGCEWPRLCGAAAFHLRGGDRLAVVSRGLCLEIDTVTGVVVSLPPDAELGEPVLRSPGAVLILPSRAESCWYGFRVFVPERDFGAISVYFESRNLQRIVERVLDRATDLEDPDFFGYVRGHRSFAVGGVEEAAGALERALLTRDAGLRQRGALAIGALLDHLFHGCFDESGRRRLERLEVPLRSAARGLRDARARQVLLDVLCRLEAARPRLRGEGRPDDGGGE